VIDKEKQHVTIERKGDTPTWEEASTVEMKDISRGYIVASTQGDGW